MEIKNIGLIATRFFGTDGVSLESKKWADVLERMGNNCFYFAGKLDKPSEKSFLAEEAYFMHPEIQKINEGCFDVEKREYATTKKIDKIKNTLKQKIHEFIRKYDIDVLIVENAFAIPMNIPLALALTEYIAENNFPTIGHHHDFHWERDRFSLNVVNDYLKAAFPPDLKSIEHVVISSMAKKQLSYRRGISATIVPNVMDFENPPEEVDDYASDIRGALGIKDEYFILQPTRIVKRKGIDKAILLVNQLQKLGLKIKFVITHEAGDEGHDYQEYLRIISEEMKVEPIYAYDIISDKRGKTEDRRKIYTIWDVYPHADLVTYPSEKEGFGNAFLETIYHRKPIVVNNYSVFHKDIGPEGFWTIELPGFVTTKNIELTREVLKHPDMFKENIEINYNIARKNYSYSILEDKLNTLLKNFR